MGRIVLTEEEEREIALYDRTNARWLPGARGPGSTLYHNPRTGQEFRLPYDPYSIARYSSRGLILGPAPEYLKQLYATTPKEIVAGVVEGKYDDPVAAAQAPLQATPAPTAAMKPTGDSVTLAILETLRALTEEVKSLKQQVNGPAQPAIPEPHQLSLFD